MDLQSVKSQYGAHWAWARTAALILFLVTAMLLAASLTTSRSTDSADAVLKPGADISALIGSASTG